MVRQVERKMIYDYVWNFFRDKPQWPNPPLGPVPTDKDAKYFKVLMRKADMIVWDEPHIVIIEATMRPDPGHIQELKLYSRLFKRTPRFEKYWDRPQRLIYLTTVQDEQIRELVEEEGQEYIVYSPDWVANWWKERLEKFKK